MNSNETHLSVKIMKFILWPLLSCLILFGLAIYILTVNTNLGFVVLIAALFNLVIFIVMIFIGRKSIAKETLNLSLQVSDLQKTHLEHLDYAHTIVDQNGKISWFNDAFYDLIEEPKLMDMEISSFFSDLTVDHFPSIEESVTHQINFKDSIFKVIIHKHIIDGKRTTLISNTSTMHYYSMFFFDVTKEVYLSRINQEQKGVIGFIYVDNYDEIMESIEDVRRPLLVAIIDRNLHKFAKSINGVLRKMEKDKFIIFFQKKYLKSLEDNKVPILDEIRAINIGNELPITISMGIGIHDSDYTLSQDYARIAIDLALGRGGDQAIIKNHDKFSFYGGKTQGIEVHTRVKARIKAYAFKELINESENVIIMGHKHPDLDSLGAAIGVAAIVRLLEKDVHIVLNSVTTAVRALHEAVTESPNFPGDLFISNQKAMELTKENTTLVIVDVNRPSYLESPELLKLSKKIVVFDHHRVGTDCVESPVLSYIETYASSTCEMVTDILRYITDKVKLDPVEADALFAGIMVDTKSFIVKTGVKTFEAAAFLRRNGADVIRVRNFFKNDMETYKARASAVKDSMLYRERIAISYSPSNIENATLVAAQAADELLNISGIKASFVLTTVDETIYISARSIDDINVQLIMEKLGGGGHLNVAGAQLSDMSVEAAINKLKATIDEILEEGEKE